LRARSIIAPTAAVTIMHRIIMRKISQKGRARIVL
jgi:hypothetical protein